MDFRKLVITVDFTMIGAKLAKQQGRFVSVSPAMGELLEGADSPEEIEALLEAMGIGGTVKRKKKRKGNSNDAI